MAGPDKHLGRRQVVTGLGEPAAGLLPETLNAQEPASSSSRLNETVDGHR
jgi:hypothetical protein